MAARAARSSPPFAAAVLRGSDNLVLPWLLRLRWLAVAGQLGASWVGEASLGLDLPVWGIAACIGVTVLTNVALGAWVNRRPAPAWLIPGILLLDVLLFSLLLYLTGGPENPFWPIYLVHVAVSVAVLGPGWNAVIIAVASLAYGLLFFHHRPLQFQGELPTWAMPLGSWIALVVTAVVIAYFVGQAVRSIRLREQELAEARELAAQSEMLASLTTLAAGAAHELGTPLGTIAVVARELELAADRAGAGSELGADARLIRQEVDRCRSILGRMRVDLKGEASKSRDVAVEELISVLRDGLREPERDLLRVWRQPELATVRIPFRAVEQALGVILRNAFDASRPGTPVDLRLAVSDGRLRVSVQDSGVGMDAAMLRRVGEPFFTTKEPGKGMGLGLFLARMIARNCGGDLRIESEAGKGTTCVLELPEARMSKSE
jgi:two-component system sensor histidine kinase RegB